MKQSKPQNSDEVYEVMKDYCDKKQFNIPDYKIQYMAEDCFLLHESRGWKDVKYWPAVAMRHVLNNRFKFGTDVPKPKQEKPKGKTARDVILEKDNDTF